MDAVEQLESEVSTVAACDAMGVSRSSFYRCRRSSPPPRPLKARPKPERALSSEERQNVLDVMHSSQFVDKSPYEIFATLLDEGVHHCSVRTMYRFLEQEAEVRERRDQCRRPAYAKPELLATGPNQVWSWDITKLRAAKKWTYYYLYVLLDIYSRYVVGWMLAHREDGELAAELFRASCESEKIEPNQLTVHADRGSAATSKTLAQLFVDLALNRSHSRPYVSNDNPFSEAQFKTLKYQPGYPDRFGSYEHALSYSRKFFPWYNTEHHHSGIAFLTPEVVHHGRADIVLDERQRVLGLAYANNPERFVNGQPRVLALPQGVWINPPEDKTRKEITLH